MVEWRQILHRKKLIRFFVVFCLEVGIPSPPRSSEPCSRARGKWQFKPNAEHCSDDIIDYKGFISLSVK